MLNNLIEKIHENSKIKICEKEYNVLTKSVYSPVSDVEQTYVKYVLTNHNILLIVPYADFICLGHIENVFGEGKDFPEIITYDGVQYSKIDEDYQIVRHLEFGDPLLAEGEVFYADYGNDNSNISISLGFVSKNNTRADVIQQIISVEDVELE